MDIKNFEPMPSRPCDYCLELQDASVFVDLGVDNLGHIFLIRISFDRFGCCEPSNGITTKMALADSNRLISAIEHHNVQNPNVERILRTYFTQNKKALWEDALLENDLL